MSDLQWGCIALLYAMTLIVLTGLLVGGAFDSEKANVILGVILFVMIFIPVIALLTFLFMGAFGYWG